MRPTKIKEAILSKLNVGVGAEFPVDSAEPATDDVRDDDCAHRRFRYERRGSRRMRAWRRGPFFFAPLLAVLAFIAMISMAISYPGTVLALIALSIFLTFALRGRHWHERFEESFGSRDDGRNRNDDGPQPDAGSDGGPSTGPGAGPGTGPGAAASGRS